MIESVAKWRQYLLGRQFIIRTDHKSVKELLTQVVHTPKQQYFLRKLLGYQFVIEYKPGHENSAADSLSRMHAETILTAHSRLFTAISSPNFAFTDILRSENQSLADLLELHKKVQGATKGDPSSLVEMGI